MKIHLSESQDTEQRALIQARAAYSTQHELVDDPASADVILVTDSFASNPKSLLESKVYREFPERCAAYNEDDNYLPLIPGVYCSAQMDEHTRAGRVFSYAYVSRNGRYQNPYLAEGAGKAQWAAGTEKRYLFSFLGGSTSILRKRLFNLRFDRADVLIEDTSRYYHWDDSQPDRRDRQLRYAETLAASHFVLCPHGAGAGSIRLFEVMAAGIAPVLLADKYALPPGPDWDSFLLRYKEREIARLPALIEPHLAEAGERGRLARAAFEEYFSVRCEFDRIVELAAQALHHGGPTEAYFRRRQARMIRRLELWRTLRPLLRAAVLRTLKLLKLKNPYKMNER